MSDTPKMIQSLRDQVQACIISADYQLAMQDYEAYESAMQKANALTEMANDIGRLKLTIRQRFL
jgi:hypothetical protein